MRQHLRQFSAALDAGVHGALSVAYGSLWAVIALVVLLPMLFGAMPATIDAMRTMAHLLTFGMENDAAMMSFFVLQLIWLPAVVYGAGIALKTWLAQRAATSWDRSIELESSVEDIA